MPSATYALFAKAMIERKQVLCRYDGYRRELCPVILGHNKGREVALTYQFAGEGRRPLPPEGQWKCLFLAKINDASLRDGPWRAGASHAAPQSCVESVDLDVNASSPYGPKRSVTAPRQPRRRRG